MLLKTIKMKLKKISQNGNLEFYTTDISSEINLPLFVSDVSAGFPSPADDYIELRLDLNKHLIQHPAATFYVRVKGTSMINAGINDGDMLIIDKSIEAKNNDVVVCVIDGEFTVKRIIKNSAGISLLPDNPKYDMIKITEDMDFKIWGVVTYVIHKV